MVSVKDFDKTFLLSTVEPCLYNNVARKRSL